MSLKMTRACCQHRGQQAQHENHRSHRCDSHCHHKSHHHGYHESLTRNFCPCNQETYDNYRISMHRSQSLGYDKSHHHHDHRQHSHNQRRRMSLDETSSIRERILRPDTQVRSGQNYRHSSQQLRRSQGSDFTPLNYGTPGCRGCQQARGQVYTSLPGPQQPLSQGGWYQVPPQQQGQYPPNQLQNQSRPPPPELEELRKNVFKGIREFSKSLKEQQWFGDMDYVRSNRKVRHGHKPEPLNNYRKKSRRRDWALVY